MNNCFLPNSGPLSSDKMGRPLRPWSVIPSLLRRVQGYEVAGDQLQHAECHDPAWAFGEGIVATASDLCLFGSSPTNILMCIGADDWA